MSRALHAAPAATIEPIFMPPVSARLGAPGFVLRRGLLIGLTAAMHLLVVGGIALTDLLMLEIMKPPRAATNMPIIFRPPGPLGGGGGQLSKPSPPRPAPPDAPLIQPAPPKPVVFPMPPPAETNGAPETLPGEIDNAGPGDGIMPGSGTGQGSGRGTGIGDGTGDGDGPGGPGIGPDGEIYPEHHPQIRPPVLIASSRTYPRYPELARKAGVQASVILLVVIDEKGRVGSIEVMSAPDARYGFDLATIEAVKQWRYHPALLDGRPVAVQASITFEFSLSR